MFRLLSPEGWSDYELIDSGGFEKLERFGKRVLRRPESQAVWSPALPEKDWKRLADARFVQKGSSSGTWERKQGLSDQWQISYRKGRLSMNLKLALTGFKHTGIFPEQAVNWDFVFEKASSIKNAKILNLFAYTGGASLAARAAGADVVHCDSIRQVVNWASENMKLSGLDGIRWLVEDAFSFVKKEALRGNTYNGIILDPPAWGHGPRGEKWKLEEMIGELMKHVAAILDPRNNFLVFNAYSLGFSALILQNLAASNFKSSQLKNAELGELFLPDKAGRKLPTGVFCRFSNSR